MIDRTEVTRALAKAIAYKACDQHQKAAQWAAELVRLLECADVIDVSAWRRPTVGDIT